MKNKMFPFPILLGIFGIIAEFLVGSTPGLRSALFVTLMFIVCWYAAGPEMKPPVHPNFDNRKATVFDPKSPQEHYEEELNFWYWSKRLYEDRAFRNGAIVFALSFVLAGTLALTCFSEQVLLWRGILVMSLCALGLLALLIDVLLRRKRGEETDPTKYPAPEVNMNYDHEAAADVRVRALQQRLERLEEWQRSGMIDDKEYRKLRNQYLSRRDEET